MKYTYWRRGREPDGKWNEISKEFLEKKLYGYYNDVDKVVRCLEENPGETIVTTGWADYKAIAGVL